MEYIIEDTKTSGRRREIPMADDVSQGFQRINADRPNPKTPQYLMGHSDIGVTLNAYTHLDVEDAKEELNRVANGKIVKQNKHPWFPTSILFWGSKLCHFMRGYAKGMSKKKYRKAPAKPGISIFSRGFRI